MYGTCSIGICSWPLSTHGVVCLEFLFILIFKPTGFPDTETFLYEAFDVKLSSWWLFASLSKHPTWSGLYVGSDDTIRVSFANPVMSGSEVAAVFGVEYA